MNLYRGDNIFNERTEPGLYRNNGLRSKAFGGGSSPENIETQGLIETVRRHIKPVDSIDNSYYDVTDYISFSESIERALYWCKDRGRLVLQPANDYEETRYLFTLRINENQKTKIGEGIYSYFFKCNYKLKTSDSGDQIQKAALEFSHNIQTCPICKNETMSHQILLINSHEYLLNYKEQEKYEGALEFAKRDNEWLVLPFDTIEKHRTTRIPRADFWNAEHFKVVGEQRPANSYL